MAFRYSDFPNKLIAPGPALGLHDLIPTDFQFICHDARGGESKYFQAYLSHCQYLSFIGRVRRFVRYRKKDYSDQTFISWYLKDHSFDFKKYGVAVPNEEAGYMSVAKYNKPPVFMTANLKTAFEWVGMYLSPYMGNAVILSDSDAISLIDKTTSSGYPYTMGSDSKDKLSSKGDYFAWSKSVSELQEHWSKLATKNPVPVLWTNSVKEEIRPSEKLFFNKLRTFVGPPITHVFCAQKLFGMMNNQLHRSSANIFSWVGSTKFYSGWNQLFNRLSKHPNAFELDCSEYDSSLNAELLQQIAALRFSFLRDDLRTPDNLQRIINIYDQIINSYIVCTNGEVIRKCSGNPSGSVNTIDDNTICQLALMIYAYLELNPGDSSYSHFFSNVELALCGDDNTGTISDEIFSWFNPATISGIWTAIGIVTKYGNTNAKQELINMHFCAQSFVRRNFPGFGTRVVPVPDSEKVLVSMALYSAKGSNIKWSFLRAQALLRESLFCSAYPILRDYLSYLRREHYGALTAKPDPLDPTDFSWDILSTLEISEAGLLRLYLGESSSYLLESERNVRQLLSIKYDDYASKKDEGIKDR